MYIGLHVKYPLFLSYFHETWNLWTDLRKILKNQISWKSVWWEPSCPMRTWSRLSLLAILRARPRVGSTTCTVGRPTGVQVQVGSTTCTVGRPTGVQVQVGSTTCTVGRPTGVQVRHRATNSSAKVKRTVARFLKSTKHIAVFVALALSVQASRCHVGGIMLGWVQLCKDKCSFNDAATF